MPSHDLAASRPGRRLRSTPLIRFGVVGLSGLFVNALAFWILADGVAASLGVAAFASTQVSTLWNFAFTERWVFAGRRPSSSLWFRLGSYALLNNAALVLRSPLLFVLVAATPMHAVVANIVSLGAVTIIRYAVASGLLWRGQRPEHIPLMVRSDGVA